MRRLLFNPLAQQPYASGEYKQYKFVLDKPLELGHIYYCVIYDNRERFQTSCFINATHENYTPITTAFNFRDAEGINSIFCAKYIDNEIIIVDAINTPINDNESVIYVYKLM